jgi:hypothetical protein
MRAVAARGRWIWVLSGLVTTVAIVVPGTRLITVNGQTPENAQPQAAATRTVTVPQPVTSLSVQSYGAAVQITAEPVHRVRVVETIMYDTLAGSATVTHAAPSSFGGTGNPGSPISAGGAVPAVVQSVSGGRLSLADPACASSRCSVSFAVTVPAGVTATVITDGGPVTLSGIAGANVDSGGGPVSATTIGGPLTVSTEGGSVQLDGLAGTTATVSTGGGSASMTFSAAPDSVTVSTDGGPARLAVPGAPYGPYALTADSDGGPQSVAIATNPAAARSITVTTDSGYLWIGTLKGPQT